MAKRKTMTKRQAGKNAALRKKGLPKQVARRIATGKRRRR